VLDALCIMYGMIDAADTKNIQYYVPQDLSFGTLHALLGLYIHQTACPPLDELNNDLLCRNLIAYPGPQKQKPSFTIAYHEIIQWAEKSPEIKLTSTITTHKTT